MNLYLIRHADAVPLGERGIQDDADRPLTEAGESQATSIASALRRHGIGLDLIVTSPLLRARQTAEGILRDLPAPVPQLVASDELAFGGKRRKLARFLRERQANQIALIGHQPDIDKLAGWLIGSKRASLSLAKAAVACIEVHDDIGKGCGTLVWLIPPDWIGS